MRPSSLYPLQERKNNIASYLNLMSEILAIFFWIAVVSLRQKKKEILNILSERDREK